MTEFVAESCVVPEAAAMKEDERSLQGLNDCVSGWREKLARGVKCSENRVCGEDAKGKLRDNSCKLGVKGRVAKHTGRGVHVGLRPTSSSDAACEVRCSGEDSIDTGLRGICE